jgi:hypothetical protein
MSNMALVVIFGIYGFPKLPMLDLYGQLLISGYLI